MPDAQFLDELSPEQQSAAMAQINAPAQDQGGEDPLDALTPEQYLDLWVKTKNDYLKPDVWAANNPERVNNPGVQAKLADIYALSRERGFSFGDIDLGKAAMGVVHSVVGMAKYAGQTARSALETPVTLLGQPEGPYKEELLAEQAKRATELGSATESAVTGLGELLRAGAAKVGKYIGKAGAALKRPEEEKGPGSKGQPEPNLGGFFTAPLDETPEERQAKLRGLLARTQMQEKILKGEGTMMGTLTGDFAKQLEAMGHPVDPAVAAELAAGDPVTFLAFPGGFKLVTAAGKQIARVASRTEAVALLNNIRTAQRGVYQASRNLSQQQAAFRAGGPIAAPGLAEAPDALRAAQAGLSEAQAAAAANPISRTIQAAAPVVEAIGERATAAKEGVKALAARGTDIALGTGIYGAGTASRAGGALTDFVTSFLPPLATPRALRTLATTASGVGQGVQNTGRALLRAEESAYSPRIRLISDMARTAPDIASGAAKGFLLFDVPLAAATSESPTDTAHMPVFAATLGALGKVPKAGQRFVQSQLGKPFDSALETSATIRDYPGMSALNRATQETIRNANDPQKTQWLAAIRQFIEPTGTQIHWVEDRPTLEGLLRRYSPGQSEAWYREAAQQRGVTLNIRGEDGQPRNVVILNDVSAAPHEATHPLQQALGEDAMGPIRDMIWTEYAPIWDERGWNYVAQFLDTPRLQEYINRGEGWQEAINDIASGNGNWRETLTPEQATDRANTYLNDEISAEIMDVVLKNRGPSLVEQNNMLGRIARIVGKTLMGLGIEPFEGLRSEGQGTPVTMKGTQQVAEAFRSGIEGLNREAGRRAIEETPTFGRRSGTPEVSPRGETAPETETARTPSPSDEARTTREIAETSPDAPSPGAVRSPREILTDIADSIEGRYGLRLDYASAPGEPAGSILSGRAARRAVIEAFRHIPDSARTLFEKTFFPERTHRLQNGRLQVLGWAPEVFAANAWKMAETLSNARREDLSPYPIDSRNQTFTDQGWRDLHQDLQTFVQNQVGGRTGSGQELVVPRSVTDQGFTAPEVSGSATALPQNKADFISALFGIPVPRTPRIGNVFPRNLAGQRVSEATIPGRVSPTVEPRAPFSGRRAQQLGIEGETLKNVNPFVADLEAAGLRPQLIEAMQRLNMERISNVEAAPDVPQFRGNEFTLQAGFQPRESDVADYNRLVREFGSMPLEDKFGPKGIATQKQLEEIKNRNGGNPPDKAPGLGSMEGNVDASGVPAGNYQPPRVPPSQIGKVGEGFQPPETPRQDNTALGLPVDGVDSRVSYAGESDGLIPARFQPKADGHEVTTPSASYKDADTLTKERGGKGNLWVRQSEQLDNADRTLLVQITPDLMYPDGPDPISTPYYDKLYSGARKGYARAQDFWEIPQWAAVAAHNIGEKADFYAVRDVAEAQKFLEQSNYGRVAFSVMDVGAKVTDQLVPHIKGNVDLGGYTDRTGMAAKNPKAKIWDSMNEWVESLGLKYSKGFDYRHFRGTEIIPRLELSAGCRHRCSFCTIDRKVTNSPIEEINTQVDAFKDLNAKLVYLNDKTFGQSPNVKEMPRLYKEMKAANPEFDGFVIQTTAAQMKLFTDEFLKESGIRYVELGVETYNDPILKNLRKPATEKLIDEAVDKLRRNKINFIPNIVIGFPEENAQTYARTMDFLNRNADMISHVNTYNLAIYEGTEISTKVKAKTAADADENSPNKSFYADPQVHADFAKQIYEYGNQQLDKPAAFQPKTQKGREFGKKGFTFERSGQPGFRMVTAFHNGEQVGEITAVSRSKDNANVDAVFVAKDYRRQGLGETLYRELLTDLQGDGIKNVGGMIVAPGPIRTREKLLPGTRYSSGDVELTPREAMESTPEIAQALGRPTDIALRADSPLSADTVFQPKTEKGKALVERGFEIHRVKTDSDPESQNFAIWVTKDGERKGYLDVTKNPEGEDFAGIYPPGSWDVSMVKVTDPTLKRKGIGEAMYREAFTDLKERGVKQVTGFMLNDAPLGAREKVTPGKQTYRTSTALQSDKLTPDEAIALLKDKRGVEVVTDLDPDAQFQPGQIKSTLTAAELKQVKDALKAGRLSADRWLEAMRRTNSSETGALLQSAPTGVLFSAVSKLGGDPQGMSRLNALSYVAKAMNNQRVGESNGGARIFRDNDEVRTPINSDAARATFQPSVDAAFASRKRVTKPKSKLTEWEIEAEAFYRKDPEFVDDILGGKDYLMTAAAALDANKGDLTKVPFAYRDLAERIVEHSKGTEEAPAKDWNARYEANKSKASEGPGRLQIGNDSFGKAWLKPNGELATFKAFHSDWLGQNADEMYNRWGFPKDMKLSHENDEASRRAAVQRGFGRVNLNYKNGDLRVELRAKDTRRLGPSIEKLVDDNADLVDQINVTLFNDDVSKVVGADSAKVFSVPNEEKSSKIPFVEPSGAATPATSEREPTMIQRARAFPIGGGEAVFQPRRGGDALDLPGFERAPEPLSTRELSEMNKQQKREYYPEAVVPRDNDKKVRSEITESPLYREAKDEPAAVDAFARRLVEFARQYESDPAYQRGAEWYSDFTPRLKKQFGDDAPMMAELLAATSPNTNPEVNFGYAFDALKSYKDGRFNKILPKFEEGLEKIADGSWEPWITKEISAGKVADPPENPSSATFLAHWIDKHNLQPTQSNGKLYGMHSLGVLRVLARRWMDMNAGPKTRNFVENLLGVGDEATIDVWDDRTMRWAGYEGFEDRWRILPENSTGVSDKDFAFSQKAFRKAADTLGMKPSALQGALWFAEKKRWADNGWGRLDLGDFRTELEKVPLLEKGYETRVKRTTAQNKSKKITQTELEISPRKR